MSASDAAFAGDLGIAAFFAPPVATPAVLDFFFAMSAHPFNAQPGAGIGSRAAEGRNTSSNKGGV